MKVLKIFLAILIWPAIIVASVLVCPQGINNTIAFLLENNFFLPKESCLCTFRETVPAEGSGEGWEYGEDNKYYYALNDDESYPCVHYYFLKKGQEPKNFNKHDSKTWDKKEGRLPPEELRAYAKACTGVNIITIHD